MGLTPDGQASAKVNLQAEAPSWGPVTEIWTKKSKTDYEGLQARFKAADIDGYVHRFSSLTAGSLHSLLKYGTSC